MPCFLLPFVPPCSILACLFACSLPFAFIDFDEAKKASSSLCFSRSPSLPLPPPLCSLRVKKKKRRKTKKNISRSLSREKKKLREAFEPIVGLWLSLSLCLLLPLHITRHDACACHSCAFRGQSAMSRPRRNSEEPEAAGDDDDDASTDQMRARRSLSLPSQGLCSLRERETVTRNTESVFEGSNMLQLRRSSSEFELESF